MVPSEKQQPFNEPYESHEPLSWLILHNDDVNTFDHVIESLCEVVRHDEIQAEQCAMITHYKGKCDIKKGTHDALAPLRDQLQQRYLSVTIDT